MAVSHARLGGDSGLRTERAACIERALRTSRRQSCGTASDSSTFHGALRAVALLPRSVCISVRVYIAHALHQIHMNFSRACRFGRICYQLTSVRMKLTLGPGNRCMRLPSAIRN